jgi:hypothetical protein
VGGVDFDKHGPVILRDQLGKVERSLLKQAHYAWCVKPPTFNRMGVAGEAQHRRIIPPICQCRSGPMLFLENE